MNLLPSKSLAQQTTLRTMRNSWAGTKHLNDRLEGQSNLRPEGLAEEERRLLPTLARLRTASPTGRPGQTPLPTPTRFSDRECAEPASVRLPRRGRKTNKSMFGRCGFGKL